MTIKIFNRREPTNRPTNRDFADVAYAVGDASPLRNNSNIQTVVIDADIVSVSTVFYHGLLNLKTVIVLGNARIGDAGGHSRTGKIATGDMPTDHDITYVYEAHYQDKSARRPCIADNNYWSDKGELFTSKFYDNRADYVAAAAPIIANAVMTSEAWSMLPTDIAEAAFAAKSSDSLNGQNDDKQRKAVFTVGKKKDRRQERNTGGRRRLVFRYAGQRGAKDEGFGQERGNRLKADCFSP